MISPESGRQFNTWSQNLTLEHYRKAQMEAEVADGTPAEAEIETTEPIRVTGAIALSTEVILLPAT